MKSRINLVVVLLFIIAAPSALGEFTVDRVLLPVADVIYEIHKKHNTFPTQPSPTSTKLESHEQVADRGLGRWKVQPGTDIIYDVGLDGKKPTTVGLSHKITHTRKHDVQAKAFHQTGVEMPDKWGAGASHQLNVDDQTRVTTGVTYETIPQLDQKVVVGMAQVEQVITGEDKLHLGARHLVGLDSGDNRYNIEASYTRKLGATRPKERKHRPWISILHSRRKLEEGGLPFGEEPKIYADLVESYLAFADSLETSPDASPSYMSDLVASNNMKGKPLGLSFNEHTARECRADLVYAARAHALMYYEKMKDKYPFHNLTEKMDVYGPRLSHISGSDFSVAKKCVDPSDATPTRSTAKGIALGTQ
ncbi:MAG: hypothetical protein H6624_11000 [Bdellovibrionaceae bacterium]|nr:hypothetical protein [Bdellovibrionales bacterium]MCB9084865.1 hypothetical protein [Pseudobdellovibrionaceae bacterium]